MNTRSCWLPLRRTVSLLLFALIFAVVASPRPALAQAANSTPGEGGGGTFPGCRWYLIKYWADNWGWINIEFTGERTYGTDEQAGSWMEIEANVSLNGTYLPSQTLTCRVTHSGTVQGPVAYPEGDSYTVQHNNPDCDSHAILVFGYDPSHSFWVSEELWNTNAVMANAASGGGAYWTSVGQELNYTTLSTHPGGDSGVYPHPFPEPGIAGRWDPGSNQIWLDTVYHGWVSASQWEWLTAHELGHAIGFGHSGTYDHSRTIMMNGGTPGTGMSTRPLEKCSAVKAFPVDIQTGN